MPTPNPKTGWTALHCATLTGDEQLVRLFKSHDPHDQARPPARPPARPSDLLVCTPTAETLHRKARRPSGRARAADAWVGRRASTSRTCAATRSKTRPAPTTPRVDVRPPSRHASQPIRPRTERVREYYAE
eukprot:SAG11_NODE_294_length_11142_cov_7.050439_3_plen_131_part_00